MTGAPLVTLGTMRGFRAAVAEYDGPVLAVVRPSRRAWLDAPTDPLERYLSVKDPTNADLVLMALARQGVTELAGCFAFEEDTVIAAAIVGATLGCARVLPIPTALQLRDKSLQKACVGQNGVRTTPCLVIDAHRPPAAGDVSHLLPGVIKPVAGSAVERTERVDDYQQFTTYLASTRRNDEDPNLLLERWVEVQRELYVDGLVHQGQLQAWTLGAYSNPVLELRRGRVMSWMTLDPTRQAEDYARAIAVVAPALAALGLADGIFHMELLETATGQLLFGECGARAGGALIPEAFLRKRGYDLYESGLRIASGRPPQAKRPPSSDAVGGTFLPCPPGRVLGLPTVEEFECTPGIEYVVLERRVGETMPDMRLDSTVRAGLALVTDRTEDELALRMREIQRDFAVHCRVEPESV